MHMSLFYYIDWLEFANGDFPLSEYNCQNLFVTECCTKEHVHKQLAHR